MTETMKTLAEKMAEYHYPPTFISDDVRYDDLTFQSKRTAYLAGFEARDGMDARLREEHADMLEVLKSMILPLQVRNMHSRIHEIKSLIQKTES